MDLLPCPFCGGDAEIDTQQGYANYSTGARETGIAIYCRDCSVQQMICRGDVPDVEPEHVIELWNTRTPSEAVLVEALEAIVTECHNDGYPNEIVATRMIERIEETALAALAAAKGERV